MIYLLILISFCRTKTLIFTMSSYNSEVKVYLFHSEEGKPTIAMQESFHKMKVGDPLNNKVLEAHIIGNTTQEYDYISRISPVNSRLKRPKMPKKGKDILAVIIDLTDQFVYFGAGPLLGYTCRLKMEEKFGLYILKYLQPFRIAFTETFIMRDDIPVWYVNVTNAPNARTVVVDYFHKLKSNDVNLEKGKTDIVTKKPEKKSNTNDVFCISNKDFLNLLPVNVDIHKKIVDA